MIKVLVYIEIYANRIEYSVIALVISHGFPSIFLYGLVANALSQSKRFCKFYTFLLD
jgi:hypothetical protein